MDISRTGGLTMRTPKAWGQPCPHPDCTYAQMINRGNIRAISTYLTQSGKRRIFQCTKCGTPFSETRDTVFFDLKTPEGLPGATEQKSTLTRPVCWTLEP